jgi:molybdopterin biosynthesis enzyme
VLDAVVRSTAEEVAVGDALGRVLAEHVEAAGDVPPFANSAMDGFLVAAGPPGGGCGSPVSRARARPRARARRRRGAADLDRRARPCR